MNSISNPLKTGPWLLTDLKNVTPNGANVFSIFSCGGGSTMGYKLAGYRVIGCCEIDPEMLSIYRANHNPKYPYLMGVQDFKKLSDAELKPELFSLDILDGSPPCSTFSIAGSREKKWGKATHFREGQAVQVLDDLFFHFIDVAKRLQPKVVVAENVKGLVMGNARGYVKEIFQAFSNAGYKAQLFLLNASMMGVPQRRERTVFIASRSDLKIPKVHLEFNEPLIPLSVAFDGITAKGKDCSDSINFHYWQMCQPGESFSKYHPKGSLFAHIRLNPKQPAPTLTSNSHTVYHWETKRNLSHAEYCRAQSFPDDFNFLNEKPSYVCGMSVPPFMMQRVADQIWKQWLQPLSAVN